jgi:DNA invertase Pin-like site-specific DNA recombinase
VVFSITSAFAEFERSMIRQRIHAGLQRARQADKAAKDDLGQFPASVADSQFALSSVSMLFELNVARP